MLIGDGAHIEAGASLGCSVLGRGTRIGVGAIVQRSVTHDNVLIGARSEIVDSIVGRAAEIGVDGGCADMTIVGADARVATGTRISAGRVGDASQS